MADVTKDKVCVVITGSDRPDSLKCNLELFKYAHNLFDYTLIVSHTGTDGRPWSRYVEDKTVFIGDCWELQSSCAKHLNTAVAAGLSTDCRWLLYLNADVMFLREQVIFDTITEMARSGKFLGGCSAGYPNGSPYNHRCINTQWMFIDLGYSGLGDMFPIQEGPKPDRDGGDMWNHCLEQTIAWSFTAHLGDRYNIDYDTPSGTGIPLESVAWPASESKYDNHFHFMEDFEPGPNSYLTYDKFSGRWQNILGGVTYSHSPDITRDGLRLFGYPSDDRQVTISRLVSAPEEMFAVWDPPYVPGGDVWFDTGSRFNYDGHEFYTESDRTAAKKEWKQLLQKAADKYGL